MHYSGYHLAFVRVIKRYSLLKTAKLIREQLDSKIIKLQVLDDITIPPSGWIYAFRQALSMSLRQLAQKLSITPQSVKEIEERENHQRRKQIFVPQWSEIGE